MERPCPERSMPDINNYEKFVHSGAAIAKQFQYRKKDLFSKSELFQSGLRLRVFELQQHCLLVAIFD